MRKRHGGPAFNDCPTILIDETMIPIPLGERTACTVTSKAAKLVRCEQCGRHYAYLAIREGHGEGMNLLWLRGKAAKSEAQTEAEAEAREKLLAAIDPVPCPGCGWFQSNMIGAARSLYLSWLSRVGVLMLGFGLALVFFFLLGFKAFPDSEGWTLALRLDLGAVVLGALLIVVRYGMARRFQPNQLPEATRISLGNAQAMIVEDPKIISAFSTRGSEA